MRKEICSKSALSGVKIRPIHFWVRGYPERFSWNFVRLLKKEVFVDIWPIFCWKAESKTKFFKIKIQNFRWVILWWPKSSQRNLHIYVKSINLPAWSVKAKINYLYQIHEKSPEQTIIIIIRHFLTRLKTSGQKSYLWIDTSLFSRLIKKIN